MNELVDWWAGSWGDEYQKRNRVNWRARIPFWKDVIDRTGARSVFELGCACGWNLSSIRRTYPDIRLTGTDINDNALAQAVAAGLNVSTEMNSDPVELTFTAGVLIHIPPSALRQVMESLVDKSCDYVLAIEYESDREEEILYRGHEGKLWRRNYGKLYQELGLTLVDKWDAGSGFDRCTAVLLKK